MATQKSKFSFFGIGLGSIALLMVLVHFWAGPFSPQPTVENVVAEKVKSIRDATVAALKGEEAAPPQKRRFNLDAIFSTGAAVLGGLALILAVIGFARHESVRVAGGAAVLGGVAIAFQFAAMALGAIILAILVAGVLSSLDFDFLS